MVLCEKGPQKYTILKKYEISLYSSNVQRLIDRLRPIPEIFSKISLLISQWKIFGFLVFVFISVETISNLFDPQFYFDFWIILEVLYNNHVNTLCARQPWNVFYKIM